MRAVWLGCFCFLLLGLTACAPRYVQPRTVSGAAEVLALDRLVVGGVDIHLMDVIPEVPDGAPVLAARLRGETVFCVHYLDQDTGTRVGRCEVDGRDIAAWLEVNHLAWGALPREHSAGF